MTVGESKGGREQDRCRVVSCRLVTPRMALGVGELAIWLAEVVGMRSDGAVDDVGN